MTIRQYTAAQLLALRDSPLVVKPDNLPAIEQWIEYVYLERPDGVREKLRIPHSESTAHNHSNNTKRDGDNAQRGARVQRTGLSGVLSAGGGGESSPMGSFSTGRPTLPSRPSTLRGNGDDVSLGPPRTMFPSSRNVTKTSDFHDRTTSIGDAPAGEDSESARSKFFSDRQLNRRSLNNEKEGSKDSWTTVRDRREGQKDRDDRFGRHDKDDPDRRNGFGDRHDPRWSNNREERRNGDGRGGWRDREQQRREREGDRGHGERGPEWMDEPIVKRDQELGFTARTQEDFQKWKDSMSKKAKLEAEKEESGAEPTTVESAPLISESKPTVAPLKLDGFENGFGAWGPSTTASQSATTPGVTAPASSKPAAKAKTSRFASMFVKPAAEEPAPSRETTTQKAVSAIAQTSAEDQEGFNRVLQMLGSTKLSQAMSPPQEQPPKSPPPVTKIGTNGAAAKPKSRFTDVFAQKDPERLTSPQQGGISLGGDSIFSGESRGMSEEGTSAFDARQPEKQVSEQQVTQAQAPRPETTISPVPGGIPFNALREQQPRPQSGRMNEIMFDPPSRGPPTPDVNIQNLLAQQRQRPQHTSNESQQLLNLLRKDTSHLRPGSQGNASVDQAQVHHWLEQQQRPSILAEPHAPKPRVPQQPPGLFEEQLMRNYPMEQQRQDLPNVPEMTQRRAAPHPPPGLSNEQQLFLHQQQQHQQQQLMSRRYNEMATQQQQQQLPGVGRRMGAHPSAHPPNLPQMQLPHQGQQFVNDFQQITSPGGQTLPPPGFGPRQGAPGFTNNFFPPRDGPPPPGLGANNMPSLPPGHFGGHQGMPGYMMRSPTDGMPPPGLRGNPGRGFDPYEVRGQR